MCGNEDEQARIYTGNSSKIIPATTKPHAYSHEFCG